MSFKRVVREFLGVDDLSKVNISNLEKRASLCLYREGLNNLNFELIKITANDFYFKHIKTGKVWEFRR